MIRIEIYRATRTYYLATKPGKKHQVSQWYWHAKSRGRITADGGEGYKRKAAMLRSIASLFQGAHPIIELEDE